MNAKHTPGPWLVHIDKGGGNWEFTIRTKTPHNPAGTLGKHIATPNKFLPEIEANAALIAAAPNLLALAKHLAQDPYALTPDQWATEARQAMREA